MLLDPATAADRLGIQHPGLLLIGRHRNAGEFECICDDFELNFGLIKLVHYSQKCELTSSNILKTDIRWYISLN